ncbi:DNA binding [Ascochyta rabiei]|uniref:DNA binding n=1 Tax=Didymella rabiei TaxID=5454 RepID=A0A162WLF0_DIDRA|nr:DNA binding [Ascochyta rabiei]
MEAEETSGYADGQSSKSIGQAYLGTREDVGGGQPAGAGNIKSKDQTLGEVKNFWDAMHQRSPDDARGDTEKAKIDNNFGNSTFDDLSEPVIVKVWGRVYEGDHNHIFGPSKINGPISSLHPSHVHIFRLWQIYSDNINPLLKVTHAPTLQARILDAAVDVTGISRELEALMFSIYCVALISIEEEACRKTFGEPKAKLLKKYQAACHQALINCGFLRSRERDCLTAFFLYLVSLRPDTHPHSLSPMFAIAFRIAYRMNIANESANAKHGVFEAEMRRRLWWALILYDSRISEMSDYKTTQLIPTWDCKIPANVNDFDVRPEISTRPLDQEASTEALFAVVRGAIGDFIRHNALHLDFINPMLKHVAKATQHLFDPYDDNLHGLESIIESRHLKHCTFENPLHYITIWWARYYLAKYRFLLHCSQHSRSPADQTLEQRDAILSHALRMLECDTALMSSPLTKGYRWLIQFHFPFPAYVRIVQDLRLRPVGAHADKAWESMNANYAVRFIDMEPSANLLFKMFASTVLQAWTARHAAMFGEGLGEGPERMIGDIKKKLGQPSPLVPTADDAVIPIQGHMVMLPPSDIHIPAVTGLDSGNYFQDPSLAELNTELFDMDWSNIDWTMMSGLG